MLFDLSAAELIHLRYQSVEELTVVAHQDHRTVESPDSLLQHILRLHVEVVGGLIEDQQVHGFKQQPDHCQTTALTTAQHLHPLLSVLAAEHKGTQDIVDPHADIPLRHIVDGLEHRERLIQQLRLVLCEIANLYVMSDLQRSREGDLAHDTFHQC